MKKKLLLKFWRVYGTYNFGTSDYCLDYITYEKAKERFDNNSQTDTATVLEEVTFYEKNGLVDMVVKTLEEKKRRVN